MEASRWPQDARHLRTAIGSGTTRSGRWTDRPSARQEGDGLTAEERIATCKTNRHVDDGPPDEEARSVEMSEDRAACADRRESFRRGRTMEILTAEQLTRKTCVPCEGGVPPLS